ncbi:MAG: HDIG domain-containing metalloprotein [Christensenellales bacterium]|jgi:putative nucleotidyltransferase with HDIG domain
MGWKPDRQQAYELLKEYNSSESLINHALAVEGVMRFLAAKYGEDVEKWGAIGLLHDIDYEMFPDQHCVKAQEILREKGVDEEYIHAVASHGYGICTDIEPEHLMEKVLYTVDELAGFINAVAIMRPSKSVHDLSVKSVKKKFKTPSFAAKVDRSIITRGAKMWGVELDYAIEQTILGLREIAADIGLAGEIG